MAYWIGLDEAMVGRVLTAVALDPDRELLTLTFRDGEERYRADGDCCSQTWVEHLSVPDLGDGATITAVKGGGYVDGNPATEAEYEESRAHRDYLDVLRVYQSAIVTTAGEVVIEYRNDSNGYYGGSLVKA